MSLYGDDTGAPRYEPIADTWHTARGKAHPCAGGCADGIRVGDSYRKVTALVDGEFTVTLTCNWCDAGYPRPGSVEEAEDFVAALEVALEDEQDYRDSLDAYKAMPRDLEAPPWDS